MGPDEERCMDFWTEALVAYTRTMRQAASEQGVSKLIVQCPICSFGLTGIFVVIMHVNDEHEMSFLEIADWLEKSNLDLEFTKLIIERG